jgi:alpha,alpha-trehalase
MSDRTAFPEGIEALVLHLDGVVTDTARLHTRAWQRMFDDFLAERAARAESSGNTAHSGEDLGPFDPDVDYPEHLDGLPRYDGVASFLSSRGIELERGAPNDPPERETVCGLGNRKNGIYRDLLRQEGVEPFPGTVRLLRDARARGLRTAVYSSSRNCRRVLAAAGVSELFDVVISGRDADEMGLAGKPAPDILLEAVRRLEVPPAKAAVLEDAAAGVEAARRGHFGFVVGIDRAGVAQQLRDAGANLVVGDPGELEAGGTGTAKGKA